MCKLLKLSKKQGFGLLPFLMVVVAVSTLLMTVLHEVGRNTLLSGTSEKLVLKSLINYSVAGVRNRVCFTNNWNYDQNYGDLDNIGSCSTYDFSSLNSDRNSLRLLFNSKSLSAYCKRSDCSANNPPELQIIESGNVLFSSLANTHPLYDAFPWNVEYFRVRIERMDQIEGTGFVSFDNEIYLGVTAYVKREGKAEVSLHSKFFLAPREMNQFSLVLAGDLDINFTQSSTQATLFPVGNNINKGVKFHSPIFVNGDLTLPRKGLIANSNHELFAATYVGGLIKEIVSGSSEPFSLKSASGSLWSDKTLPRRLKKIVPEKQDPSLTAWNAGVGSLDFSPHLSCIDEGLIQTLEQTEGYVSCWGANAYGQSSPPADYKATKIVGSERYSCGLKVTGETACWGSNLYNQFPPSGERFLDIAAGNMFTCGIGLDRVVSCQGTLSGDPLPDDFKAKQIVAGESYACGIGLNGSVTCWGASLTGRAQPANLYAVALAGGSHHVCAIELSGSVSCWGNTSDGRSDPPAGLVATQLSLGKLNSCAIDLGQRLVCWGSSSFVPPQARLGALNPIHTVSFAASDQGVCWMTQEQGVECFGSSPLSNDDVPTNLLNPRQVFSSSQQACVLGEQSLLSSLVPEPTANGQDIFCWGGYTLAKTQVPPVKDGFVLDAGSKITSIVYAESNTYTEHQEDFCLVNGEGKYECWNNGWIAKPSELNDRVKDIAMGAYGDICALKHDTGHAYCWRPTNRSTHNGFGPGAFGSRPSVVRANWEHSYLDIAIVEGIACAIKQNNGSISCWGKTISPYSQTRDSARLHPPITWEPGGFVQIEGGSGHFCARTNLGTVKCWGSSEWGAIEVPVGLVASDIATGNEYSCAIESVTSEVQCWGRSVFFSFQKPANLRARKISVGDNSACAVQLDNTIQCWGNRNTSFSLPGVIDFSLGGNTGCALLQQKKPFKFNSVKTAWAASGTTDIWTLFLKQDIPKSPKTASDLNIEYKHELGKDSRPYVKGLGVNTDVPGKTIFSFLIMVSGYDYISDLAIEPEINSGIPMFSAPRMFQKQLSDQTQNPIRESYMITHGDSPLFGHISGYKQYENSLGEKVYDTKGVITSIIVDNQRLQSAPDTAKVRFKLERALNESLNDIDHLRKRNSTSSYRDHNIVKLVNGGAYPSYTSDVNVISSKEFLVPFSRLRELAESTDYQPFGLPSVTYRYYTQETLTSIAPENIDRLASLGLVGAKYRFTNHGSGDLRKYDGDDLLQDFSLFTDDIESLDGGVASNEPLEVAQCRQDFRATLPNGTSVDLSTQDQFTLTWGEDFSIENYLAAWSFAIDEDRLNCDDPANPGICGQDKVFLTGSDFQVYADIKEEHTCVIRKHVPTTLPAGASVEDYNVFAGFIVCPQVRIEIDGDFSFVGTIITKKLKISSSGSRDDNINFYNIYHPEGLRILREYVLNTRRAISSVSAGSSNFNSFKKCADVITDVSGSLTYGSSNSSPSWDVRYDSLFRDCGSAGLRDMAQPLKWTSFTPDCDPTQSPVACKDQPLNFIVREIR